ncbi:hypothetical protein Dsin_018464 [Dipteronia sinensis]|uniref:Reverse transcriptase n=1 Tax=Dipteronia sinensis TaxID=43782 RepID=A0AAE0E1Y6_9ROSI|nr:hypothetical protein Dsin_018464 [Dipteronia sinensis]
MFFKAHVKDSSSGHVKSVSGLGRGRFVNQRPNLKGKDKMTQWPIDSPKCDEMMAYQKPVVIGSGIYIPEKKHSGVNKLINKDSKSTVRDLKTKDQRVKGRSNPHWKRRARVAANGNVAGGGSGSFMELGKRLCSAIVESESSRGGEKATKRGRGVRAIEVLRIKLGFTGDFNEILTDEEKQRGAQHSRRLMENFKDVLDYCQFENLGFQGPMLTWSNERDGSGLVYKHLDRGVRNLEWYQLFPKSYVSHLDFWFSDHRPILVEALDASAQVERIVCRGRRRFHIEACWANREDCHRMRALQSDIRGLQLQLRSETALICPWSWAVIRRIENRLDEALAVEEAKVENRLAERG